MDKQNNIQGKSVYEYMAAISKQDLDIYDDETDICVIAVYMEEWSSTDADNYAKFVKAIISKVEIKEKISEYQIIAKWSDFVRKNKIVLWKFAENYWKCVYNDERMVKEWIREIHAYFAGKVPEDFYDVLLEMSTQIKS